MLHIRFKFQLVHSSHTHAHTHTWLHAHTHAHTWHTWIISLPSEVVKHVSELRVTDSAILVYIESEH
jgi:hypothetical protein